MAITFFKDKTGRLWNPSSAKHCLRKKTTAEILFKGDFVQWKHNGIVVSSMRANIGDTVKYINSTTVGCYDSSSVEKWRVVATKATDSVLWEYIGTPAITNFTYSITSVENKTITATGVSRQKVKYAVNVTAGSGWTAVYTNTSNTATSGNPSGYKYANGTRVYYFAETTEDTLNNYSAPFTLGTPVYNSNGVKRYCIGSVFVLTSGEMNISIPALEPKPLTIYLTGVGTDWKVNGNGAAVDYMTAYYGDYLSISGNIVTCKYPSKAIRWTVTASIMADTSEWDFGGNVLLPTKSDEKITSVQTIENTAGTAVKKKYAVYINGLGTTGSVTGYLNASSTATTGSASGTTFDYGTAVYAFAKVPHLTLSLYNIPSNWTYVQQDSSYAYYIIGSLGAVTDDTNKNVITTGSLSSYAKQSVTIGLSGTGITWKQLNTACTSMTAYVGDTITNTASDTVVCSYPGADGSLVERWRVIAYKASDTAQYTYKGTPSLVDFSWTLTSTDTKVISAGGVVATERSYTITWKYLSAYPSTWTTTTQSYKYGTTPSRTNADTVTSGNERKVFASWDNLATVTGSRTITATYKTQYAPTISPSYCTANRTSGTWYDSGTVITWTANDNYSFGGSTVKDTTTTTITAGNTTYSKSPSYVKCTISGTRCTPSKTSGSILAVGTSITYTASSGYSYTEHATTASNPDSHTVALGTTSYSRSCDYKSITVSGTNCTANISTGYRKIGATITWTALTSTNTKYSFSNTSVDASETATISTSTASYSKTASYLWYNVTIKPATNCTANKSSGYLLKDSTVTFTATEATASNRCSFSNTDSTVYTKSATVSSAGQTISSGTVYIWRNVSFSGTNCSSNLTAGWILNNTPITWTANTNYAFDSAGTTTASDSITQAGTYNKTAGYGKYTVSAANSTANVSTGWYQVTSSKTTTFTAKDNYSFGGSTLKDTTTKSAPVPGSVSAGPSYCQITVGATNCTVKTGDTLRVPEWAGIVALGTTITWTANTNYAFNSSGNTTNTATVTNPGTYSITANYGKLTVNAAYCTANVATGWYAVTSSKSVTYTANDNWSFGGSSVKDTTTKSATVPGTILATPTYCKITVSGSNCTITVDGTTRASNWSGLVKNGATIRYTANTNYAFDANGTATKTVTISGPNTYSNSPSYGWYAVSTTNCTSNVSSGWYAITSSKTTTFTANDGWSFAGSAVKDTKTASAAVPGSVTASPTNFYITVQSGTGCSANVSTGMKSTSNPPTITWTASSGYAFNSSGTTTASQTVNTPGTYSKSPTHGYYTLNLTNCSYSSGNNAGWYALGTKPSTTVQANSSWSFGGSSRDTKAIGGSAAVPTSASASPTYFYLTFSPTNCTCSASSGYYTSSTKPSSVTWTPTTYYSFAAGATQSNTTTTISTNAPNTYSASPQYVRAASIATGTYNASVDKNANTYYAANTVVTWTAKTNYYYGSSSSNTTSTNNNTKITAGATITAPNPTHIKCTISGTNCAANQTNGSILAVGTTITWTGTSGTNYKYSFSNTNANSTTSTATVALGTTSYSKSTSYLYYNVTISPATNCIADIASGYKLNGTTVTFTTATATSTTRYSFSNTSSTSYTKTATVSSAGQTISSGTVYTWYNITVSSTNCTTTTATGWHPSGNKITWTAATNYAFDSAGTATKTVTIDSSKTYTGSPTYGKLTVTATNCTAANATGWYGVTSSKSTTFTANDNRSFGGSSVKDTTSKTSTVPGSVSASPGYCKITVTATNCSSIKVGDTTRASGWSGIVPLNTVITWTASSNYAFNSSGTTTATSTVTAPGTFTKSPGYGKLTVTATNCSANASTTWYAVTSSKSVTFTANDGWSFAGSSVKDTTSKTSAVPGSVSASPGYCKITVNTTNCSAKVAGTTRASGWSGIVSNGATIDYTASTNYAFTSAGKTTLSTTVSGPNTYTATPTYAYYTLSLTNCTYQSGSNSGWYSTSSKPSTVVKANSGWSFAGSSQDTKTIGGSAIPSTASASPTYFYLTFNPTNCTCSANSGYYTASTKPSSVTWTPNTYYSFASGTTQQNSTTSSLASSPTTYSASPLYVRAKSIETGTYNSSVDKNASTYYSSGAAITWTAKTNYYYDGSGTTTSKNGGATIAAGATIGAPTPTHVKCTISSTNCTADKTSGSILAVGTTITWTRTTGTNYKFSFSNTNADSTTSTETVALGTTSYGKVASNYYLNVIISPSGNCTATKSTGYLLNGSTVTFVAPTATTSKRYSFSASDSTTITCNKTVDTPGQTITNDTVYVWMNCTFSGTNLASKPNDGWYRAGSSSPIFTAGTATNIKYSFTNTSANSPTTTTTVTIVDGTTSYAKNASYEYYNVTITKNAGTKSSNYSSGYLLKDTNVIFYANDSTTTTRYSYSNSDSTVGLQTAKVSSAGQTISSNTIYTWYNITVSSTNCTANVASGWRLNGTTITWTPNTNYSFSAGATQTNTTATVSSSSLSYSAEPVYVKPASVSLVRCTCTVNDKDKYYDKRQSYLVSANTNCAFNSTGTTTTQSLTLTAGAAVSYNANYVNVTKLTGTNCSTTATTGWKQAGTKITWTANAAYAFDTSNLASMPIIVAPGENTCTASYVKRYTYTLTKNSNVTSIKVWRTSSPYQGAATSTSSSPLINGTGTATIYYGDVITGQVTAATNYHFNNGGTSLDLAPTTVNGNLSWSPTAVGDAKVVTITAGDGISSVYLSSSSTATSGSASGTTFPYGSTVYGFVTLNRNLLSSITLPSGWTAVGSGDNLTYRVGSGTVTTSGYNFGTMNATLASYPIALTAGTGINGVFLSTNSSATSGSASGTSFKAGTTVYAFVLLNTSGYQAPSGSNWSYVGNGNVYRIGSIYVTSTYSFGTINATAKPKYNVSIYSNRVGIQNAWLSTSSTATTGSTALNVTSGTVVYSYVVLGTDTYTALVKNWTLISGTACKQGAIYRTGSQTITAAKTITVNLFDDSFLDTTILFTRSGESVGSWTVNTHTAQMADDYGGFVQSGNSFSLTGDDYNGNAHTYGIASFTCPSGYTVSFTITKGNGTQVVLNSKHYFDGPYTIEAETTPSAPQS